MNFINESHISMHNRYVLILSLAAYVGTGVIVLCSFPFQQCVELLFLLTYMTFACTFFPLPTPQVIMDYGGRFDPLSVAVVAGIGTCLAGLIDYTLIVYLDERRILARLKQKRIYEYSARFYRHVPFISIVVAGFTPIPFEPVRFLAATTKYDRIKYVLAIFVGRAPRYYLLAKFQEMFHIPRSILIGSVLLVLVITFVKEIRHRRTQDDNEQEHIS